MIAFAAPMAAWAQDDPTLTVSAKKQVVVGERFQVVFEANAEGKNFQAPSFEGFTVVGGPFTSTSSSFSMVNGSMSHSVKVTYTFALQAYQEGTFRVGAATLTVKGNKISSEPFEIKVLPDDGSNSNNSGGGYGGSQGGQQQSTNDPDVSGKDLFLRVTPSKRSAYVGEQVVLTYKLYTKVPVSSLSVEKMPSYAGFWTKDVSDNNNGSLRQSSEYINGIEYTTAEIQKIVVVPQRSGKLSIDPMTIECIAQIRTESNNRRSNDPFDIFFNDPFFNRNIANVRKELSTQNFSLDVKNLPETGKPASFAGAVGDYTFKSTIDKTDLKTNEAFTLTLSVSRPISRSTTPRCPLRPTTMHKGLRVRRRPSIWSFHVAPATLVYSLLSLPISIRRKRPTKPFSRSLIKSMSRKVLAVRATKALSLLPTRRESNIWAATSATS